MSEKEISTLIKSIVDSCRTFYVGTASAIDDEGYVTLNGIRAAVVGIAEQADVILKDATSGAWVAFIRGTGEVVSTKTIKLYLSLPTQGEISLYFFVSAESLQNVLTVRGVRQIVGVFGLSSSQPYYTELAPWITSIPTEFSFEGDYLNYTQPKGAIHLTSKNASFVAVNNLLQINVSSDSLPGTGAIDIKKIESEAEEQTFIQFYIKASLATSGIRRAIERWSLGIGRDSYAGSGAYGAASLPKSLCIGFKNEVAPNYSKFYAWYRHRFLFESSCQDNFDLSPAEACGTGESYRDVVTEFPITESYSDRREFAPPLYDTYRFSPSLLIPPASISLPEKFIVAFFHFGDGDFVTDLNVSSLEFSHYNGNTVRPRNIYYEVEKEEVLAKRMKVFILIEGVKYYGKHVRYGSTEDYRLGFFKDAQSATDTELVYFGDTYPQEADPEAIAPFLLSKTITFSTPSDEVFPGDDFLWSNLFRAGSFSSSGFVDVSFPEQIGTESCTFIRATAEELEEGVEGGYVTSASIQIEILSSDQWVYKESLNFFEGSSSLLQRVESPRPRTTPDTLIRVAFREKRGIVNGISALAGYYGKSKESTVYHSSSQTQLIVSLVFRGRRSTLAAMNATAMDEYYPWTFGYFPGQRSVSILHEYTGNFARKAKLYIERDGIKYYAYTSSLLVAFYNSANPPPLTSISNNIFYLQMDEEMPRKFYISSSGTGQETPISTPFFGDRLTFTGQTSTQLSWESDPADVAFDRTGWMGPVVGGIFVLYGVNNFEGNRTPATIQIEYAPESEWAKTERVTIDGSITVDSPFVVRNGEGFTNTYLRVLEGGATTTALEANEVYYDLDSLGAFDSGFDAPCSTSVGTLNRKIDSDSEVFHGFFHLSPGASGSIDLSATNFSFSGSPIVVYAEGKLSFQGLNLIPFDTPLDTKYFTPFDPYRSGYVGYTEGFVDNSTKGINEVPCLRVEWRRGYRFVPGALQYDSDWINKRYVDFEVLFIDLDDRIDVVFRYLYLGFNNTSDPPLAGITEETCILPGSKTTNGLIDLTSRKVSSENSGEIRFYIQDGKICGYDEVLLFEDGQTEAPIRRCIPPMRDLYRDIGGLLRIESNQAAGEDPSKKISLYLSDKLTGEALNLTNALPPTFAAETGNPDFYGQPPLENINKVI
jgi:hypothetical protein